MNPLDFTGLELMQLMGAGKLPTPSISNTIPMDFNQAEISKGGVEFTCTPNKSHLNPLGGVHGGFSATVLDSAASCAVHTMLDRGQGYGTTDLNIKMMRPLKQDTTYKVTGKIINMSRRLGVAEASIYDDNDKIYAHATVTCIITEVT